VGEQGEPGLQVRGLRRHALWVWARGQDGTSALLVRHATQRPAPTNARREQQRTGPHLTVETVSDAPVPGDGVAKVLDLEAALEAGGKEAAKGGQEGGEESQGDLRAL